MLELLGWLEDSAMAEALRGAGVWTYALINLGHVLGLSTLFGSVLVLDLRLIGLWRGTPLTAITRPTVPLASLGFVVAITSGVAMLSFNATDYHGNPFLYVKLPVVVLGLLNAIAVALLPAWRHKHERELKRGERIQLAAGGFISLLCWVTVVAAGRMIGYW